ncbi:galactokinase [Shouchella sp. JSM 1781072]|uniref:galactokinase n=1 Tax=Bacillaceae TaxID=186817 RepID=UPI000C06F8D3|nr:MULTISPECIES: galactokinase [Bacillaceae]UTR07430.1 galactokinase [Alkalihalobacillus sp. LMS6]
MTIIDSLKQAFNSFANEDPQRIYFSPGRVNLIGEHTDYNSGYVFPAALEMGTYLAVNFRNDETINMQSANFQTTYQYSIDNLTYSEKDDWSNYPKGVLREFQQLGYRLPGMNLYFFGDLPNGAGLSSSASIEMVTAYFLNDALRSNLNRTTLAQLCQRVENHYIGVNSGIMDQYAVGLGKEAHALFIDTKTLHHELVPLELGEYALVLTNSNKKRGLADSKYNERRAECEQGVAILQEAGYQLESLSDLTVEEWQIAKATIQNPVLEKRINHIVTENHRVQLAVKHLKAHDIHKFGHFMCESHDSLATDYDVTGNELDLLYAIQKDQSGCIGTRMTGAGFGGCTVSLVHQSYIGQFKENVAKQYHQHTKIQPDFYTSLAGDGVKKIYEGGL